MHIPAILIPPPNNAKIRLLGKENAIPKGTIANWITTVRTREDDVIIEVIDEPMRFILTLYSVNADNAINENPIR